MAAPALPNFGERSVAFARACFNGPLNIAISLICVAILWWMVPPLISWFIWDATRNGTAATCRENSGSC